MNTFLNQVALATPLFVLVFLGYALMRFFHWPKAMSDHMTRFVFSVALPAMRHRLILNFEAEAEGVTTDHILSQILKEVPRDAEAVPA